MTWLSFINFALIISRVGLAEILQWVSTWDFALHSWPSACHQVCQVHHPLAVAPLIVIPSHDLDHIITHDHGERRVNGRGDIGAPEIHRHKRDITHIQDALQWTLSRFSEGFVHILSCDPFLFNIDNEVDNRDIRGWDSESNAIELALELG
uniref:Uncharacterized protein n=1 Tax=Opuntia streptacantha TaxID=393608 RepID=A0A7C8YS71_OPUST